MGSTKSMQKSVSPMTITVSSKHWQFQTHLCVPEMMIKKVELLGWAVMVFQKSSIKLIHHLK